MPILLILCGTTAKAFPFSTDVVIGKIVPLEGLVVVRRKSEGITVKPPAMIIYRGDNVLTNDRGKARILLTGGNEVFVGPSSNLYLNKSFQSRYNYEYNLNLKGKLRAKFQRTKGRRFRIKTSTAVINVKGTDFIVDSGTNSTQVATFTGLVQLTSLKTNQQVDIPPGKMSSVTPVGKVSEPKKVEIAVVKNLENTGKTGIKDLDTIMKPPPPLDPSINIDIEEGPPQELPQELIRKKRVAKAEPPAPKKIEPKPVPEEPPSMWFYAEEYRKKNRLGFGFGAELGAYVGNFLFVEYNLTARSQVHSQYVDSTYEEDDQSTTSTTEKLQRKLGALSFRWFLADSGLYLGLGVGHSTFEHQFQGSSELECSAANGSFYLAELGAQTYGQAYGNTFYVSVGSQVFSYHIFNGDCFESAMSADEYTEFKRKAENSLDALLIGFGWFF